MRVPSFSKARNTSRTGDRLTWNLVARSNSRKPVSRLEVLVQNRISDLSDDHHGRLFDLGSFTVHVLNRQLADQELFEARVSVLCVRESPWSTRIEKVKALCI